MDIKAEIERLREECAERRAKMKWLIAQQDKLKDLPPCTWAGEVLDFDNLKHAEVIKVVRALGGKWAKTPNSHTAGAIDYNGELAGKRVRCWAGEAPPSCRLIEVEEHVPEKVIPAHTVKKMVMKCHPEIGAVIATAAAKAVQPVTDEVSL